MEEGSIGIYPKNENVSKKPFFNIKEQTLLCHEIFYSGGEVKYQALSKTLSRINCLSFKTFLKIIKENQSDYEKYHEIKDKIFFHNDFSDFHCKCYLCGSKNHHVYVCPNAHLDLPRSFILAKFNYSRNQERACFERRTDKFKYEIGKLKNLRSRIIFPKHEKYFSDKDRKETKGNSIYAESVTQSVEMKNFPSFNYDNILNHFLYSKINSSILNRRRKSLVF